MNLKKKFLFFTIILLFPCALSTQPMLSNLSPEEVAQSMEENLTWNLQNELSNYYPNTKFVIKANIKLFKSLPSAPKTSLPSLPTALVTQQVKDLPGLPLIPDKLEEQKPTDEQKSVSQLINDFFKDSGYRISRISINTLVDSSFSRADITFIRRLITIKSALNTSRGDRVNIEVLKFPERFVSSDKSKKAFAGQNTAYSQPIFIR